MKKIIIYSFLMFSLISCGSSEETDPLKINLKIYSDEIISEFSQLGIKSSLDAISNSLYVVSPSDFFQNKKGLKIKIHHSALIDTEYIYTENFISSNIYKSNEAPTDIEDAIAIKVEDDCLVCFPYIHKNMDDNDYLNTVVFTKEGKKTTTERIGYGLVLVLSAFLDPSLPGELGPISGNEDNLPSYAIIYPNLEKMMNALSDITFDSDN